MELRSTPKLTEIHQCWYFFSNLLFSSCVVGSWVVRWVSAARRQHGSLVWVCDSGWWRGYWVFLARAWAAASWCGQRRHSVMYLSLSLSHSRLSLSFLFFFSFFLRFWLFRLILESTTVLDFLLLFFFFFSFFFFFCESNVFFKNILILKI